MPEKEFLFLVKLQSFSLEHYQNEFFHKYFSEVLTYVALSGCFQIPTDYLWLVSLEVFFNDFFFRFIVNFRIDILSWS